MDMGSLAHRETYIVVVALLHLDRVREQALDHGLRDTKGAGLAVFGLTLPAARQGPGDGEGEAEGEAQASRDP